MCLLFLFVHLCSYSAVALTPHASTAKRLYYPNRPSKQYLSNIKYLNKHAFSGERTAEREREREQEKEEYAPNRAITE